ncbi:hypothetical protein CYLTODRAFT_441638 [Cylindrobasidium torrendii FP15055 ss-10]|uniref:Xaa-Pro dipeptidyl-peptidase-like domain-containing protein n=1 Tax=Cylindrobasidium torrendii FP15055 ss-10 TaxID=1314674 RepID=A0A0D7BK90_9AGAR|nr:hypothetical protein CYLTODRAFT_441638 [Cylindrobasidium torrendii FP15055 ss-10]
MKTSLKIPSMIAGWNLDAWQYLPGPRHSQDDSQALPVIVMAHGLTATKKMGLDTYAEVFVQQGPCTHQVGAQSYLYGVRCLIDGVPRSVVDHNSQQDDYRTVVRWVRQQKSFDPHKVVIWGSSYSCGHVIALAADRELGVKAAISQCPWKGVAGPQPLTTTLALMTASSLFSIMKNKPGTLAAGTQCPLVPVAPKEDNICLYEGALQVAAQSDKVDFFTTPVGRRNAGVPEEARASVMGTNQLCGMLSRYNKSMFERLKETIIGLKQRAH